MKTEITTLDEKCLFINGGAWKQTEYADYGIPVVQVKDMQGGTVIWTNPKFLPESSYQKYSQHQLKTNDLVIATVGSHPDQPNSVVGRATIIPQYVEGALLNQNAVCIRPKDSTLDKRYLGYIGQSPELQHFIAAMAKGAANQVRIAIGALKQFPINLPPLQVQQRIAEILSTYDRLIDNNNRRIALLEESIHLLYKDWFVRLRFPGHESVKLVDGIPEGWKFKKLEELGLLGRGKSKHRPRNDPSLYGGKFPFIQTGEVKEASLYITNYKQTYNEKGLAQSKLWEAGTLLITIAANIAETAILTFPACFPDSVVGFIADSNQVSAEFIKYSIDYIKVRMQNVSTGAAQDNLSLEKIRIFDFLVPEQQTMRLFTRITNPIFLQMKNLLVTNENLRQARDLLLPRLMNGSIAV